MLLPLRHPVLDPQSGRDGAGGFQGGCSLKATILPSKKDASVGRDTSQKLDKRLESRAPKPVATPGRPTAGDMSDGHETPGNPD